jgi:hypothetical protein
MDIRKFAKFITGGAITLAILHILYPNLGIDAVLLSLIIIAALPWIIPYLKTLEMPGGFKIEFKDAKAATDKIISLKTEIKAKTSTSEVMLEVEDPFSTLRHIAETDPNLGLVGFRIEIEKRLLKLAEKNNLIIHKMPLRAVVNILQEKNIIQRQMASGLIELIGLGNSAAHGVNVSPEATNYVLDLGPDILGKLDALINDSI